MKTYTIPEDLLQAIVTTLEELPARVTRVMLNAIEKTVTEQDAAAKAPKVVETQ
jgi:hypothetical protein